MNSIEESTIKEVTESETHFYISLHDSWSFGLSKEYGTTPKIGDKIKLHLTNATTVRGVDLNDIQVFYKSDEQLEQEHKEWCENYEKEKQETFEKEKNQLDSDYESLPDVFKQRIDRFRKNNPKFRVDYEGYEMFCCKEALKIAELLKTPEAIKSFHDNASLEEQIKLVPTLSDGHSGNTFGCACILAYTYANQSDLVSKMHGSLSPLVGSEAFGDIEIP